MHQYTPLKIHSHYSTSLGLSKPNHIVSRLVNCGIENAVLTDYNSISGSFDYIDECKDKVKPIIGCELNIVDQYDRTVKSSNTILLIAKNKNGWLSLVKNINKGSVNFYNDNPNIKIEDLVSDDLYCLTGWLGSSLSKCILGDKINDCWLASNYEYAKTLVNPNWVADCNNHISKLKELFGSNFKLGVQLVDYCCVPGSRLMSEASRYLSKKNGVDCLAIPDSYYAEEIDSSDQRVLIVNRLNTDLKTIYRKPVRGNDVCFGRFFGSTNYFIPSYEEMIKFGHTEQELDLTNEIGTTAERYDLKSKPKLPKFPTPNGVSASDYMEQLCQKGWDRLKLPRNDVYTGRYNMEKEVLNGAGLADYFLIVEDIIKFAVRDGQLTGAGRGSAAGALTLYLLGVTHADPIKYDLLFERFYNSGRNTKDNISLPDVDMDFERSGRERIISYIRDKYAHNKVCQMVTFQRMQGRGAIKDVVRAHAALDVETVNKITKNIPQEAEIADQIQALKELGEEVSLIEWALDNNPKDFEDWAFYDDAGKIQGPLAKLFEQAIRMEGTKRGKGKHAAGVIISNEVIAETCPMTYDSGSGELIADLDMGTLEKAGWVKFDILGVSMLDKAKMALNYMNKGEL